MQKPLDPLCPTMQAALDVLGRPWTALVLAVLQDGPLRFSELSSRIEAIGDKTLSARLKELEAKGLIVREVEPGPPVRVGYRLTSKGEGFRKVVEAIDAWGRQFLGNETGVDKAAVRATGKRRSTVRAAR